MRMLNIYVKEDNPYSYNKDAKTTIASKWILEGKVPEDVVLIEIDEMQCKVTIYKSEELNLHPSEEFSLNYILYNLKSDLENNNLISGCNHTFKQINNPHIRYNFIRG